MRNMILALFLTLVVFSPVKAEEMKPISTSEQDSLRPRPEQMKEFDFFVGEWTAVNKSFNPDGSIKKESKGVIKAQHFDGGRIFFDETTYFTPEGEAEINWVTIRTFDPKTNKWVMSYITALSEVYTQSFTGNFIDGEAHFDANIRVNSETTLKGKVRFYNIKENSFEWSMKVSPDNGKTWFIADHISATRIK